MIVRKSRLGTNVSIYFGKERFSISDAKYGEGKDFKEIEIKNLRIEAMEFADYLRLRYHPSSEAIAKFQELFIAKHDNNTGYEEKLRSFIKKYADLLGPHACEEDLTPNLLNSLYNESTEVKQRAKNILFEINRDYASSFTKKVFLKISHLYQKFRCQLQRLKVS